MTYRFNLILSDVHNKTLCWYFHIFMDQRERICFIVFRQNIFIGKQKHVFTVKLENLVHVHLMNYEGTFRVTR